MNRKQSLRDNPVIRVPKTHSKLTGEHLIQKCDSNKADAMHLY